MYKHYPENSGADWKLRIRLGERGVASAINKDHADERLHISVVSDIFALR